MADNFLTNDTTSTGITFASDDITSVHFPRVKLIHGIDGVNDGDVSSVNPLPVTDSAGATLLGTIDADTSAMVTALQLIDNAVSGAGFNITQLAGAAVPIGGGLEATAVRVTIASDSTGVVTVDGTVGISGTVTVDLGTNNDVTITGDALTALQLIDNAVSGAGFNITQLGGAAVPIGGGTEAAALRVTIANNSTGVITVDGTVAATQSGTWNIGTVTTLTTCSTVTNLAQLGGVAVSMGTGVRDAGTQRVTIATNDIVPASQSGTWNIGTVTTLTTCSTVTNLSQLGGQAVSMGTGARDAGTQRVTIATNDVVPASQSGTWNVGTVTTLTGITNALPSGTNLVGKVSAGADLTNAYDGTTALEIKRASGVATAENANTMIIAVADKKFRVLALSLMATSTTAVSLYVFNGDYYLLGNNTNKLTLDMDGGGGPAGVVMPWNPGGWFQTDTNNEALAVHLSAATPVVWSVTYVEV